MTTPTRGLASQVSAGTVMFFAVSFEARGAPTPVGSLVSGWPVAVHHLVGPDALAGQLATDLVGRLEGLVGGVEVAARHQDRARHMTGAV